MSQLKAFGFLILMAVAFAQCQSGPKSALSAEQKVLQCLYPSTLKVRNGPHVDPDDPASIKAPVDSRYNCQNVSQLWKSNPCLNQKVPYAFEVEFELIAPVPTPNEQGWSDGELPTLRALFPDENNSKNPIPSCFKDLTLPLSREIVFQAPWPEAFKKVQGMNIATQSINVVEMIQDFKESKKEFEKKAWHVSLMLPPSNTISVGCFVARLQLEKSIHWPFHWVFNKRVVKIPFIPEALKETAISIQDKLLMVMLSFFLNDNFELQVQIVEERICQKCLDEQYLKDAVVEDHLMLWKF